ncbi:MAG TPA: carbon-nitrogen hydrolase family protein [Cyclobacteriaceae bacterium]
MSKKVAVVQDSPVFFDKSKTIKKCVALIQACAAKDCKLVLFPESFVPGYPRGMTFGTKIGSRTSEGNALYAEYFQESIDLESSDLDEVIRVSNELDIYIVLGITERVENTGSLYCSMVYISPSRGLMGVHRKIKPTAAERIVWHQADGSTLVSFDTALGKIGGLICWENYMPLARMAVYQDGVQIYMAPTADMRPSWINTMKHIAREGRCFVMSCNQYITKQDYPEKYKPLISEMPEKISTGGSLIISPFGEVISGPVYNQSLILTADIDLDEVIKSKLEFDPVGHYSRDDIFKFEIRKTLKSKS